SDRVPANTVNGADPGPCPSRKTLRDRLGLEICQHFWRQEGVLHHGLHPNNCAQASLDLTEHCSKHTTLGAYDPLSRAVAEPVDTQQRWITVPQHQASARIGDIACAMSPAHRAGTPARHQIVCALLREERELDVPAVTTASQVVHLQVSSASELRHCRQAAKPSSSLPRR